MRIRFVLPFLTALTILCIMPSSGLCQGGDCDIDTVTVNGTDIAFVQGDLLIKPASASLVASIAAEMGASVQDSIPRIGWWRLRFPPNADVVSSWQSFQDDARLLHCVLNTAWPMPVETNDTGEPADGSRDDELQWPLTITHAVEAWGRVPASSNVLIAILDTGCDLDHPEFQGCTRIEYGFDWKHWPQFVPPEDYHGHGTHRVGEIAAPINSTVCAGINQNCRVRIDKITDDSPDNPRWLLWAAATALEWLVFEEDARVVNLSFYGSYSTEEGFYPFRDMLYAINEDARGTVVMCCAGNGGDHYSEITYPAAWSCDLECLLCVGSSTPGDLLDDETSWEPGEYGGQLSFLAPGLPGTYWTTEIGAGYTDRWGGTSGATAHASGIAGILISKYPTLERERIREQLQNTAVLITPPPGFEYAEPDCWGHPCWCIRVGSGRVDALRSLNLRYHRSCPSAMAKSPPAATPSCACDAAGRTEMTVFDLLGRRLGSFSLSEPVPEDGNLRIVLDGQSVTPHGIHFVRIRDAHGGTAWRVIP